MKNKIVNPLGNGSAGSILCNLSQCYTGKDIVQESKESKSPVKISPWIIPGIKEPK